MKINVEYFRVRARTTYPAMFETQMFSSKRWIGVHACERKKWKRTKMMNKENVESESQFLHINNRAICALMSVSPTNILR